MSLVSVDLTTLGKASGVCGARYGQQKVCLKPKSACTVSSHARGPFAWRTVTGNQLYCVPFPTSKVTAHVDPVLVSDNLSEEVKKELESSVLTPLEFGSMFADIRARTSESGVGPIDVVPGADLLRGAHTPFKAKGAFPKDDDSFAFDSDSPEATGARLKELEEGIAGLAKTVNVLAAEVGDGSDQDEPNVWSALASLRDCMVRLEDFTQHSERFELLAEKVEATSANLRSMVVAAVGEMAEPMLLPLIDKVVEKSIGEIFTEPVMTALGRALTFVRVDLPELRSRIGLTFPTVVEPPGGRATVDDERVARLEATVAGMQRDQRVLEDRVSGKRVVVANVALGCHSDAMVKVLELGLINYAYLAATPTGMLELAYAHLNPNWNTDDQFKGSKLELLPLEATLGAAWRGKLPTVFGSATDDYSLPAFPTFRSWGESVETADAKRDVIQRALDKGMDRLLHVVESRELGDEGKHLLTVLARESCLFVVQVFDWMNSHYRHFRERSHMKAGDTWALIQHAVRVIFRELRTAALPASTVSFGKESRNATDAGALLWSSFAALGVAREFKSLHFDGHPALAPAISRFVLGKVAMQDQIKELEAEIKELKQQLGKVGNVAAGAQKFAQNAQRGKKGQKDKDKDEKD